MKSYNIAVVGATGLVGREFFALLAERDFPVKDVYPFASERSLGESVMFGDRDVDVLVLNEENFEKVTPDIVFFSAGGLVAKKWAPLFAEKGAFVIDNSSAFRMDNDVALIVPEVNGRLIDKMKKGTIIANPNCSTIQMVLFLDALNKLYGLNRVSVSTYQSVSGAGKKGINELQNQVTDLFSGKMPEPAVFPQRIAFNVIPHIGAFNPDGYCEEEIKMINESRKILSLPNLEVDVTTVRVPVFYSHSEVVTADLDDDADLDDVRKFLAKTDGIRLFDDFEELLYPTPADASGTDAVFIGRLRFGNGGKNKNRVSAFVVADNVRKGAALNGLQIAETIIKKGII